MYLFFFGYIRTDSQQGYKIWLPGDSGQRVMLQGEAHSSAQPTIYKTVGFQLMDGTTSDALRLIVVHDPTLFARLGK
jgi:hypothetical protein